MTSIGKLALAAVLAAGTAGVALTAPAAAQKKKEAPAKSGLKLSPAMLKVAKPAQDAVQANNPAVAEPLVAGVEAVATTPDDKYIATLLRLALEEQKYNAQIAAGAKAVDDGPLVRPLDALIANPSTPPADLGRYLARRGQMAMRGKQYAIALDHFARARAAGFADEGLGLEIVRAKIESGDVAGGTAELERTIAAMNAKGQKAPIEYYRYAIGRANKSRLSAQTVAWMNKYAAAYPTGQTWYEILATYGLQQESTAKLDNQQKIDLFRLMRASGGLADQYFYIEYAQKAQNAGLPLEAQAVLKEGLANGKIPAGNSEVRAMQTELTRAVAAEGSLTSLEAKANAAANGQLAGQTADAHLSSGNYAKAAALYRTALSKGSVDADTINTRLGIALARSNDRAGAQAAFANVKGGPRADIAGLWNTWLGTQGAPAA
jgi:hypothetical protein